MHELETQTFDELFLIKDGMEELPTVRIKEIIIDNFKSIKHGRIIFNCGKQFVKYGTKSDILGIYGQNGSGKTSLIEAMAILKRALSGSRIPDVYADCIAIDSESSHLQFTFDLQYPFGEIREVVYSFYIGKEALSKDELEDLYKDAPEGFDPPDEGERVFIYNEVLRMSRKNTSAKLILQDIINTSEKKLPFGPETKLLEFISKEHRDKLIDLAVLKKTSRLNSKSFIFNKDTLKIFDSLDVTCVYYQTLLQLRYYAKEYLFVIDTKSSGFIRLNIMLPLYTRLGVIQLDVRRPQTFEDDMLDEIEGYIANVSDVLRQLVPGLRIGFKHLSDTILKNGSHGNIVMLVANRDGLELPLRDESDGIRKIISVLSLLIAVYNNQSFTLAIDEFDAGIFEYLLGEILQTLERSGKGQFIFTSHNLRPLEIIDKKFLVFTTTNPENRFYKLKSIGKTNNLRDSYFREILLGQQDEELYKKTKRYKIEAALRKAGENI